MTIGNTVIARQALKGALDPGFRHDDGMTIGATVMPRRP